MNSDEQTAATPLLSVKNLYAHLPTGRGVVRAVDGVSFSIEQGKTLGVVGESGCGKSIMCRALLGLLPPGAMVPGEARIRFDGRDLNGLPEKQLRRIRGKEIAMIFQDPMTSLNPVMTVGRQVAESLSHHLKMKRKKARERTIALLGMVGVPMPEERVDQFPHQLSGGLRQRVAIAIALACEPRLLIADEPTTALDVTVQADILDLLSREQARRRMAMILITHDLGVAAGRTHEIAVMYAGKIVERASTPALFSGARMPYTRALMDAIPRLADPPHTRLKTINGQPPDLIHPPAGCSFAPRCREAEPRCREKEPVLVGRNGSRGRFACWRPVPLEGAAS
ncbi:MAG: ABC transporter ATP-binding protein [Desulfobacterales bacterium]|nr:ABC transporter ATP-binding protein [Desulfobacterales bacterium]